MQKKITNNHKTEHFVWNVLPLWFKLNLSSFPEKKICITENVWFPYEYFTNELCFKSLRCQKFTLNFNSINIVNVQYRICY